MPISDRLAISCLALALTGASAPLSAFEVRDRAPPISAPAPTAPAFKSVSDALKAGLKGLNSGDTSSAVAALQYAATNGNVAAQWKLGRIYSDDQSTLHDDHKAFTYFAAIADKNADESPDSPHARMVSQAFVALGNYYLDGIPSAGVKRDRARAREMFHYAASYFGDSDAQYNLARMYLDAVGPQRHAGIAARWLNLAAEKGHAPSQAALGHLIFNGDGVPKQGARGLMWIMIAKARADKARDLWIDQLLSETMARASEEERKLAANLAARAMRQAQQ